MVLQMIGFKLHTSLLIHSISSIIAMNQGAKNSATLHQQMVPSQT